MAVVIRLKRIGARKKPFFRVVVADSRSSRDGKVIEELGHYDPRRETNKVVVNGERVKHWLAQGARPTDKTKSVLKNGGILVS
ncbi:30S ribosomal protein S16 [bacterium]|nr:30S ribosomal protein S16 [bacterium]